MAATQATTRVLDQTIGVVSFGQRHRKQAKVPRANRPSPRANRTSLVGLANPAASPASPAKVQGPDRLIMAATPVTIRVEELDQTIGVTVILDQHAKNSASKTLESAREDIDCAFKRNKVGMRM